MTCYKEAQKLSAESPSTPGRKKRILFCSSIPYPPQSFGGSQSSVLQTCAQLSQRGYQPSLFCPFTPNGIFGLERRVLRKFRGDSYVIDRRCGFDTYRCWNIMKSAEDVLAHVRPDIVIAEAGKTMEIASKFVELGVPTIASMRDVEFKQKGGDCFVHPLLKYVSNSKFTQSRLKESFGIDSTIIYPVIDASKYVTATTGQYVLHINPFPKKGIDTTMALARLRPDVRFLVSESWVLSARARKKLKAKYGELKNVSFRKPSNDMRAVYAGAKCLIVPSIWHEAWGRVVTEAHFSGIPVIASAVGGLPESVGPGGILVDPCAPFEEWSLALSQLWDNAEQHKKLSRCALDYSQRKEIAPKYLVDTLLQTIEGHLLESKLIQ